MSLVFERILVPGPDRPAEWPVREAGLNIAVVFTSWTATLTALKKANTLASRLNARITLVVPQLVPYPLPLSSPPVLLDFSERRLLDIVRQSPVEISVRLYLCRDRMETLAKALKGSPLVVLGGRKRWWPTAEARLARFLRRSGHEVILTETE